MGVAVAAGARAGQVGKPVAAPVLDAQQRGEGRTRKCEGQGFGETLAVRRIGERHVEGAGSPSAYFTASVRTTSARSPAPSVCRLARRMESAGADLLHEDGVPRAAGSASSPRAPLPANRSSTRAPGKKSATALIHASRTRGPWWAAWPCPPAPRSAARPTPPRRSSQKALCWKRCDRMQRPRRYTGPEDRTAGAARGPLTPPLAPPHPPAPLSRTRPLCTLGCDAVRERGRRSGAGSVPCAAPAPVRRLEPRLQRHEVRLRGLHGRHRAGGRRGAPAAAVGRRPADPPYPTALARDGPVGEGRHCGFIAATSVAGPGLRIRVDILPSLGHGQAERMNSPQRLHEVRLRGLPDPSRPGLRAPSAVLPLSARNERGGGRGAPRVHGLRTRCTIFARPAETPPPPRHSPGTDLSAKADIAGSLPRLQSPGPGLRPVDIPSRDDVMAPAILRPTGVRRGQRPVRGPAPVPAVTPRLQARSPHARTARPASAWCRPRCTPPPRRRRLTDLRVPHGTHPCRTCRRRPTSRFHCREFIRRVRRPPPRSTLPPVSAVCRLGARIRLAGRRQHPVRGMPSPRPSG